ncbi:DUF4465 domain-containing protein [uncultured Alistipes sp.]|uniref:DUF4465 domain-containing protein n=1 Tax=uncultured Alistipes sp. TaxID=538949 RepID=UPI0026DEED91|nr:DUF4465 domain-containing protein [uncultured Alistipes sp.]
MKKLFLMACAALAFAGCSDSDNEGAGPQTYVIDFEDANLGDEGFIWGKPEARLLTEDDAESDYFGVGSLYFYDALYTEGDASFYSLFTDYVGRPGWAYDMWNGFVISNHTDMTTPDYTNDKSVYATSGADGSSQFAVAYYGAWTDDPYGTPLVRFATAVSPKSIAVASTTYFYLYAKEATSVADVKGVITGYNGETKTGEVKFVMADQASGTVQSGWETLDLSSLGTVTSMTFTVETEDTMCPYYFAIDNLAYGK